MIVMKAILASVALFLLSIGSAFAEDLKTGQLVFLNISTGQYASFDDPRLHASGTGIVFSPPRSAPTDPLRWIVVQPDLLLGEIIGSIGRLRFQYAGPQNVYLNADPVYGLRVGPAREVNGKDSRDFFVRPKDSATDEFWASVHTGPAYTYYTGETRSATRIAYVLKTAAGFVHMNADRTFSLVADMNAATEFTLWEPTRRHSLGFLPEIPSRPTEQPNTTPPQGSTGSAKKAWGMTMTSQ
jgi:hypothetical protein